MSKISIDEIEAILQQRKIDPNQIKDIIKDCQTVVEELKQEAVKAPTTKYEHVIILYDKEGVLDGKEIAGWVVQQKTGNDAGQIISKLRAAATDQNESAKRKKTRINTIVELFSSLKSKFLKGAELKIKTKDLTRVLVIKNDKEAGNF